MAEVTALRNNALPYPIYGAPWTLVFPLLDADGDPVDSAAALDSEISKNGDTHADCTNEATFISRGCYYLTLTGTELTCDIASIVVQTSTSGAKTTVGTLYPRKLPTVRSGTAASAGSITSTIILDSGASACDDAYNGMLCVATIDTNVEARIISDYTGSSKTCTVIPDWNVAPDSDDTFIIKLPDGAQQLNANLTCVNGVAAGTTVAQLGVNAVNIGGSSQTGRDLGASVLLSSGTGTGQLDFTSGVVKSSLVQILGSAITGTAAQIAAAFTKFFDKATPTGTINSLPDVVPGLAGGMFIAGTNAATTITTGLTTTFTGNLSGSIGSIASGGIAAASIATGAITNAKFAAGAIDAAAVADGAIDAGAIATGAITNAKFAAGAIDAAAIAADAIGASELATDAVTEIVAGIWGQDATSYQVQGTFGQAIGDPAATAKSIWGVANALPDSGALTTLQADTDNIQTRLPTALVGGRMDSSVGAIANDAITAAATATDFTTEVTSGLATATNVTAVAAAVWDLDATGHTTQGTFGQAIGDPGATAKSIWGVTNALPDSGALTTLQADTDNIQTRLPTALVSGRMDSSVGAIANDAITAAAIATDAIGSDEIATAAITEIVNAVWAKAGADPSAVPAVNAALSAKIDWLTAWFRNKQTMDRTTGVTLLRDDGDATTIGTLTASDDGTSFSRTEVT